MTLCYLVFRPDSLTYTICRALSECGHEASVWALDPDYGKRPLSAIQRRLAATHGIRTVDRSAVDASIPIHRLVVQSFPRPRDTLRGLPLLAARANRITLITAGDRSVSRLESLRLQWRETRSLGRLARRIDRILYKDGFHRLDLFGPFRPRRVVGFDVHSQFLHDAALFRAMHAFDWAADAQRPILANFLGNQDPQSRKAILDTVRHFFRPPTGDPLSLRPDKSMFWHEYSEAAPTGLPPQRFIEILTQSDFALCPRGYSLVTHRPIEAMLRGSIPVLSADELDLYGVPLVDGHNCVAVRSGDWRGAVEHLVRMPESEILRMRRAIGAMRSRALEYRQIALGICRRLGLEEEANVRVAATDPAAAPQGERSPATSEQALSATVHDNGADPSRFVSAPRR